MNKRGQTHTFKINSENAHCELRNIQYLTLKMKKTMKKKSNLTRFMKQLIRSLKEEERFRSAHILPKYTERLHALLQYRHHPVQPDGTFIPETI